MLDPFEKTWSKLRIEISPRIIANTIQVKPSSFSILSANIYLFKSCNKKTRKMCETCSKLIIKTSERCQQRRSFVFIVNFEHIFYTFLDVNFLVNFEHISHFFQVFLLLPLNR